MTHTASDEPPLTADAPVNTILTQSATRRQHGSGSSRAATDEGCSRRISYYVSNGLGELFYRLGFQVATHPWKTIAVSWLLVLCCSVGLVSFHNEKNPIKLWIPKDSKFVRDTEWIMKTAQVGYRTQSVLITAPDVLTPEVMHKLFLVNQDVLSISAKLNNGTDLQWNDVCFKIPIIAHLPSAEFVGLLKVGPNRRPYNPSVDLDPAMYCPLIDALPTGCMTDNILDLWHANEKEIQQLTRDDILDTLNRTAINPVTGHATDFVHLLGDVRRNSSGHIVGAGSLLTHWMVYVNFTAVDHEKIGNLAGTEDWASEEALAWEAAFLRHLEPLRVTHSHNGTAVYYTAARSFGDISSATMFQDMDRVFIGATLMFVYMQAVLSRFGWTEIRLMLGGIGLMSVGMAYVAAIGLCSALGVSYGPVHTSLPFLLMGLGVDDIFVLMSCWRQVDEMHTGCALPQRMGLMMRHAGASITVTSITDVVAFLIGASTILPSLESFCIYAAIGVLIMYLLVCTFVVAILTLDERRIEQRRNSFVPCVRHDAERAKLCCTPKLMDRALRALCTRVIFTTPGKLIVVLGVIACAAFSTQGLLRLEQRFDPAWFIPERTYLSRYTHSQEHYYPDIGYEASIFLGAVNYTAEMPKLLRTVSEFENRTELVQDVAAWVGPFRDFVLVHFGADIARETLTDDLWHDYLSKFLYSNAGGRYQANFIFDRPLRCGQPTGRITVSTIPFRHRRFAVRNEYVHAMHSVERIVDGMHVHSGDGVATVWGRIYGNWITDEVIDTEVLRNILLALLCVMVCTLLLIAEPQTCLYIFVCVLLTLINVCGFMQRWGLTVDLVSCIGLELAVGLCVDYAAHVGHTFLTVREGTREERALETILHIGAAVLYGGGSTLLALAMLATSEAYTFQAFFKIFLLVIVFGLFHGVVFLPVVLSVIGPEPFLTKDDRSGKSGKAAAAAARHNGSLDEDEIVSFVGGAMPASDSADASVLTERSVDFEMVPEKR